MRTYCLLPGPDCRHEVSKTMDSISTVLFKGNIIKIRFKIGVWQHFMDNSLGVSKPDVIFCLHPWWYLVCRLSSIMLYAKWFPDNVAKRSGINDIIKFFSVWNGGSSSWTIRDAAQRPSRHEVSKTMVLRLQTIKAIVNSRSFKSPKSDEPRRVQVLDLYCLTRFESKGSSKGSVY